MTDQRPLLPVTQSDRDAAYSMQAMVVRALQNDGASVTAGVMDDDNAVVQSFAAYRHRLTAEQDGWQTIEKLTDDDGYVLGWSLRDDGCGYREWFIGRKYDIRHNALLNEWTGKWRMVTHFSRLPTPPANILDSTKEAGHE